MINIYVTFSLSPEFQVNILPNYLTPSPFSFCQYMSWSWDCRNAKSFRIYKQRNQDRKSFLKGEHGTCQVSNDFTYFQFLIFPSGQSIQGYIFSFFSLLSIFIISTVQKGLVLFSWQYDKYEFLRWSFIVRK